MSWANFGPNLNREDNQLIDARLILLGFNQLFINSCPYFNNFSLLSSVAVCVFVSIVCVLVWSVFVLS